MALEQNAENGPEWREYRELALDVVGFYVAWDNLEESEHPKQRKEVIEVVDLNVATQTFGLVLYNRKHARNYAEELHRRIKFNPRIPLNEREYLDAKMNASLNYIAALEGQHHDFNHYAHETLLVWPKEFGEGEIDRATESVSEDLEALGYSGDFKTAMEQFRAENLLTDEEIVDGITSAAEKCFPVLRDYVGIDVDLKYRVVPVHEDAPWRAWTKTDQQEIILEVNLSQPEGYVRGQEERIGLHEIPIHGGQIASWAQSSRLGVISPASCVTTLHTPEQISTEGLATSLPFINPDLFPLSDHGKLAVKLEKLERMVLHNAYIRTNQLPPWTSWQEKVKVAADVVERLPYMKLKDVRDRLERVRTSPVDRGYELSYAEGARLHEEMFEHLGRDPELFRLLVIQEFIRPMTAEQIRKFTDNLRMQKQMGETYTHEAQV